MYPERGPDPQHLDHAPSDGPRRERPAALGGEGLRLAEREPREGDRGGGEERAEYRAPATEPQDPLPEGRGDGGNQDEHRHRERHQPGHPRSFVLVAHQRHGHDARPRHSDALQDAARDHRLERGRKDGHEASEHEQGEAEMDGGLAPDAVGEGAEEHLAQPQSQEQRRDDELDVVRARDFEIAADRRQRRQHRVDRERDERHQEGDEGYELGRAQGGPGHRRAHPALFRVITACVDLAVDASHGQEVLDLHEVVHPVLRAFTADAGFLHASERRHLVRDDPLVDADDAVLQALGHPPDATDVAAVEVRRETELGVVGHAR